MKFSPHRDSILDFFFLWCSVLCFCLFFVGVQRKEEETLLLLYLTFFLLPFIVWRQASLRGFFYNMPRRPSESQDTAITETNNEMERQKRRLNVRSRGRTRKGLGLKKERAKKCAA